MRRAAKAVCQWESAGAYVSAPSPLWRVLPDVLMRDDESAFGLPFPPF